MTETQRKVYGLFKSPLGQEVLELLKDKEWKSSYNPKLSDNGLSLAYAEGRRDIVRFIETCLKTGEKNDRELDK